jgi:ribulose-phosphate 3-epimerase
MIVEPEKYFSDFAKYGANLISFHYEASVHHHRAIQEIKSLGCKAGIVLNPSTPVSVLEDIIEDLDLVLLMSVNPGFGGQVFIENTYKKIKDLVKLINSKGLENIRIEIDGGVNDKNSKKLIEAGADTLVAGSFVFKSENPINTIEKLLNYD